MEKFLDEYFWWSVLSIGLLTRSDRNIEKTANEVGIARHPPSIDLKSTVRQWDYYKSLGDPPATHPSNESDEYVASIYRGIVPGKNILRKDFAIIGAAVSPSGEWKYMERHWFSLIPSSHRTLHIAVKWQLIGYRPISKVIRCVYRLHLKRRSERQKFDHYGWGGAIQTCYHGRMKAIAALSISGRKFYKIYNRRRVLTWLIRYIQAADELLEDMHLPSMRSGGNWLTWPFRVIDLKELASLSEERRILRQRLA